MILQFSLQVVASREGRGEPGAGRGGRGDGGTTGGRGERGEGAVALSA